ncbi:MAG TPA: family 78 glycoside hydrolase catalytic domain [Verrucomicrobiae bacterium]|jgi:alpha-L-rhamnosidase|nr:family 78 glycoside hydrolase catalytic domain [Verrucomicrobiae bacterium]
MNLFKRIALTALLAAGFTISGKAQGRLQPFNLRCDERTNPLGIGDAAPRLSWQLQSLQTGPAYRGRVQTAYEIQVGSTPGAADLWDSGKVTSAQTIGIIYAGQTLTSGQQCFWRVRVYDNNGDVSDFSAPAQWSVGLLQPSDWTAQWIGDDAAYNLTPAQATNAALFNTSGLSWLRFPAGQSQAGIEQSLLRKKIVLPASPSFTNAIFALYADDVCAVFVNGQKMTNSAVRWEATAQINVTAGLHAGTNLLALQATNGDAQPASVIGRLVVQFASGSVSNYPVDTTWKAAQTAAANWPQTNFDDSSWTTAESTGTPWGTPSLNDIARVPAPYLRKNFNVSQTVTRAVVYVTALGAYELHLNGQKVGNDVLTPGWSDFTKRVYYQTYDVTSMLLSGANVMGAILGDGWYASDLAYKGQRLNYGGTPRFLAQLVIQFSDGSTQTVVTDNSWQASYGPILYGDLLLGAGYDARQEIPGWDTTNFNATGWTPVTTGLNAVALGYSNVTTLVRGLESNNQLNFVANNSTMGGDPAYGVVKSLQITFQLDGVVQTNSFAEDATVNLGGSGHTLLIIQALFGDATRFPGTAGLQVQAAVTEPSRCFERLAATNLTQPAPGVYTFDLGQNIAGWAEVTITGHVGDRITIRHGEMLNPDGTIYTENLRGATATDFYTFATNGTITYQPRFTFHGFRYVELRGLSVAPTLNSVTGVVVHSDMPLTGSFACSSPMVNQLYRNIIWGQKGNYLEVPTDCPQRDERMGWTGDTEFFMPTAVYNFDVQSFYHRHLVTLCEDSQHSDGSFPNVAPDLGAGSGAAAWGDAAWICTDVMYQTYGDTNVIADHYAAFKKYGQFLAAHAANFTISSLPADYNDWLNLGGGASETVIDTAFYAYYAQAMSEMAAAIGDSTDAVSYATLNSNIVSAFAAFFNPDGSFKDGSSQTGYALAFTLNLIPPALQSQASQQFANSIAQFDNHLATGFIGTPRLLPALHNAGHDDLAGRILLQQTYPSWLYQVSLGATTMWERWDGWMPASGFESPTMNSFNHYAFGAVGQYLYGAVGGINAASPGYKSILIQPVPGNGLNWAAASYNSVNGLISTAWTNTDGTFHLTVVVPPNTTAQIYVPATNASTVFESGVPAGGSPGVSYAGFTNNYAIYAVGSGNYSWSSVLPVPPAPPTVAETDSVYLLSDSFPPLPGGDLITNTTTSVASNSLTFANENRAPSTVMHDGNIGGPGATNLCSEISGGSITFYLGNGTHGTGYTITNLNTYTAWEDDGRENANYSVSYSADGTNFFPLATVAYNPSPYPAKDGTGGTVTSLSVSNLVGVRYLQWNFSANQQNGGVGYTELAAFGMSSSVPPPAITSTPSTPGSFVINATGLVPGQNYQIQSTTNLTTGWTVETNFQAAQSDVSVTNATTNPPQKFYRVMAQ